MRLRFCEFLIAGGLIATGGSLSAWAQVSDGQLGALADVLLQLTLQTTDGKGSQSTSQSAESKGSQPNSWQMTNIPLWSKTCMGRSLTPQQFATSPVTARWITVCKLREILPSEYRANGNNEAIAVRRAAAWWITGNPNQFNSGETAAYTQKILSLYQQKRASQTAAVPKSKPSPTASPTSVTLQTSPASTTSPASPDSPVLSQSSTPSRTSAYDRYMQAGYDATKRRDNPTALLYFKRALDERPNDSYAAQAIRNVESYSRSTPVAPGTGASGTGAPNPGTATNLAPPAKPNEVQPAPQATVSPLDVAPPPTVKLTPPPKKATAATPSSPPASLPSVAVSSEPPPASITDQQAIALMNRWLLAKADIFAPPYDQQQVLNLTTGELLASLLKPDGVLAWLKTNRAYFRYGAQKLETIERFVATRDRATLQVQLTEDRTLYLNGAVDPSRTSFAIQRVRFTLAADNGTWKIADYKTVDGSLLERSVLDSAIPNSTIPNSTIPNSTILK